MLILLTIKMERLFQLRFLIFVLPNDPFDFEATFFECRLVSIGDMSK